MPAGVLCNVMAVALGGIAGALGGRYLSGEFRQKLNLIFGICSIGIGISSVMLMRNMPAVVLAVILGTAAGTVTHLGKGIERCGEKLAGLFPGKGNGENNALLVTAIVLFCSSGTGIYGSVISGIDGDHSFLIAKSFLDLFTAMIFACTLGMVVSAIAIPQTVIFLILF